MVSLGDETRRQRGQFFGSDQQTLNSVNGDVDDLLSDHVALVDHVNIVYPRINTTWLISTHIFLVVVLQAAVFIVPFYLCPQQTCGVDSTSLLIYASAVLWFFTVVADSYYKKHHKISRANGYLEFYRRTNKIRQVPLLVASGANSFLLVVLTLLYNYCTCAATPHFLDTCMCGNLGNWKLQAVYYIQLMITIEMMILFCTLISFLVKTCRFNRHQSRPDVQQEEVMSSYLLSHTQSIDVGFREDQYAILEKQADMIGYLKQHTAYLSQQLLKLQEQLAISNK